MHPLTRQHSKHSTPSALSPLQLETKPLRLAYDANKNGWNAQAFHKAVDGFGATIVFARTENGSVIGGYNPKG